MYQNKKDKGSIPLLLNTTDRANNQGHTLGEVLRTLRTGLHLVRVNRLAVRIVADPRSSTVLFAWFEALASPPSPLFPSFDYSDPFVTSKDQHAPGYFHHDVLATVPIFVTVHRKCHIVTCAL
jgi:hypothetical protein